MRVGTNWMRCRGDVLDSCVRLPYANRTTGFDIRPSMNSLAPNETVVKLGVFLYDGRIECDVRIVHSPIRYGSGDYEDPPEIENDLEQDIYYI